MAEIFPFRATSYNLKAITALSKVITQPYDKFTQKMQDCYYERDPHNLVRILLGRTKPEDNDKENVYTRASKTFRRWVDQEILIPQRDATLYPYFQQYQLPGQPEVNKLRKGFVGLARLED